MARSFTSKDAKSLIQKHHKLKDKRLLLAGFADEQKQNVIEQANNLLARNSIASFVLDELSCKHPQKLYPDGFYVLISHLYKYIHATPLANHAFQLDQVHEAEIAQQISYLKPACNSVQWLFTSGKNKFLAESAYKYLSEIAVGSYTEQIMLLDNEIQQINTADQQSVIKQFEMNRTVFLSTLQEIASPVLQCSTPIPELSQLREQYRKLFLQMELAQNVHITDADRIKSAADKQIAKEALNLLKNVPIEELGRERINIRYKALHDSGYNTVADLFCATEYNLASIHGISAESASAIKRYARQYAEQAKPNTRICLTIDDQTPEATELISAIYVYKQHSSDLELLNTFIQTHQVQIFECLNTLHQLGNGIHLLFAEEAEKQPYIHAYQYLTEFWKEASIQKINRICRELSFQSKFDPHTCWDDFEHNNIVYYNILETIVPGIWGNTDTRFGLPEDLAREIQDECFFPDGLKCNLRRYQEWGVKYILHQERVLLGDEMGLGKTVQAIASMVSLRNTGCTHFMVICPASVLPNWCKEITAKSKLRVTKIHGTERMLAFQDWQEHGGVAVTNFETTGHLKMQNNFSFDMIIVDEAHYIKNSEARRTKNVLHLSEHTQRVLFMTGTALENKVDEMIALVQVLQPTIAAQLHSIAFMSSAPQFRERISPVYYRRKREDVLTELPDLIENKEWCEMSAQEEAIYEDTVLTKHYMEVRRVSWNVGDLKNSCKAKRLKEIIDDSAKDGRKVIVFSFFLDTISKVQSFLGNCCLPPINGSVSPQRRQQIIDDFDQAPAGSVLLAQIQSGGTGLNIQSASVVIFCEPQLKPSIENQAISRAYRMGQARNVLVYRLLCENTIDERITEMLADKQAIFNAFADKSVSAEATMHEEISIDDQTMGKLIKEEIERINLKNAKIHCIAHQA